MTSKELSNKAVEMIDKTKRILMLVLAGGCVGLYVGQQTQMYNIAKDCQIIGAFRINTDVFTCTANTVRINK